MSARPDFDVTLHAGLIVRALLGEPNAHQSSTSTLRYGSHGSLAIEVAGDKAGTWYDHENCEGGGMIDLITRERGGSRADAMTWAQTIVSEALYSNGHDKRAGRAKPAAGALGPIVATQITRHSPKTFRQRRPDGRGGWISNVQGVELLPYRLPEVLRSNEVMIVEGDGATHFLS
jgi:putative DNA primase/helicase